MLRHFLPFRPFRIPIFAPVHGASPVPETRSQAEDDPSPLASSGSEEIARVNPALAPPASRGLTEYAGMNSARARARVASVTRKRDRTTISIPLTSGIRVPGVPFRRSRGRRAGRCACALSLSLSLSLSFLFLFSARSWNWLEEMTSARLALRQIFKCSYGTYSPAPPRGARLRLHRYFLAARPARLPRAEDIRVARRFARRKRFLSGRTSSGFVFRVPRSPASAGFSSGEQAAERGDPLFPDVFPISLKNARDSAIL